MLDDGDDDGEVVRIRRESFTIGRVQGDLVLPHDGNISGRHAEIVRRLEGGRWQWYLRDLQSTNGTFVRVAGGILRNGQETLDRRTCFRFESSHVDEAAETASAPGAVAATRKFVGGSVAQFAAQMNPTLDCAHGGGRRKTRIPLDRPESMGRPRSSPVFDRAGRPARQSAACPDLPRSQGKWMIQNNRSLNGLWMRITEVSLG